MLTPEQIRQYRDQLLDSLLSAPRISIELTSTWTNQFPNEAGVYILWENNEVVYVGESGNIRGRMREPSKYIESSSKKKYRQKKLF